MAAAASSTNTTQGPAAAQTDAFEVFRQGVTSVFKTVRPPLRPLSLEARIRTSCSCACLHANMTSAPCDYV
eukprot:37995-Eustigmatos_ZCMA.PRE.1